MNDINQLEPILAKATPDTLVIFDVDEVLLYPTNIVQLQIASPFWEASMADIEKRLGKSKRDLLHSIMLLQSKWKLTDKEIPDLIKMLQIKNIRVLALTSFRRGKMGMIPSLEDWRKIQLKKHNIDFSATTGISKDSFEVQLANDAFTEKKPVYKNGIIYTDLHSKNEVLSAFFEQTYLKPKEIIFIDDRSSNVEAIGNFCKMLNISFIGIHDQRVLKRSYNRFNENLGRYQFRYLEDHHVWLHDAEAMKNMTALPTTCQEPTDIRTVEVKGVKS